MLDALFGCRNLYVFHIFQAPVSTVPTYGRTNGRQVRRMARQTTSATAAQRGLLLLRE